MLAETATSWGGQHVLGMTLTVKNPFEFAGAPLASGDPTVKKLEVCTGGLQDGNARGGPCWRLGAAHGA
jgi:hypothetical protein